MGIETRKVEALSGARITVRNTDEVRLQITSLDDQMWCVVDNFVFAKLGFGEHRTFEVMDIIRNQPGVHHLNVIGANLGGPWSFALQVDVNGNTVPGLQDQGNDLNEAAKKGIVYHWGVTIELLP